MTNYFGLEYLKRVHTKYSIDLTSKLALPDRQIPTILSYVDGEEYYGAQAKAFLVRNPKNTISYFRDFLGQEYVSIATLTLPNIQRHG